MGLPVIADYCGARGPLTLDAAESLRGYAFQPKIDGCYSRIETRRVAYRLRSTRG